MPGCRQLTRLQNLRRPPELEIGEGERRQVSEREIPSAVEQVRANGTGGDEVEPGIFDRPLGLASASLESVGEIDRARIVREQDRRREHGGAP